MTKEDNTPMADVAPAEPGKGTAKFQFAAYRGLRVARLAWHIHKQMDDHGHPISNDAAAIAAATYLTGRDNDE